MSQSINLDRIIYIYIYISGEINIIIELFRMFMKDRRGAKNFDKMMVSIKKDEDFIFKATG